MERCTRVDFLVARTRLQAGRTARSYEATEVVRYERMPTLSEQIADFRFLADSTQTQPGISDERLR